MNWLIRHKWSVILSLALLTAVAIGAWQSRLDSEDWRDKLIRLHVVAHSDSEEDQARKLEVRDAVLAAAEPVLEGAADAAEARARLNAQLPVLEQAANRVLEGTGHQAVVTLQREAFPLREYESFSLPAGEYEALRVTIGAGEGHNWWCVVYPSLCFAASAEEITELAVSAGLSEEEAALLTAQQDGREGYVFRFQIVELWHRLLAWLRSL